jgi:pyruvate dehydrogenase complex dehydrogenase (E1) component
VALSALHQLAKRGTVSGDVVADAITRYGFEVDVEPSWVR